MAPQAVLNGEHDNTMRNQQSRAELIHRLEVLLRRDGIAEPLPGVRIHRVSVPTDLGHGSSIPSFCVTPQGAKEVRLGNLTYRYEASNYLIATDELPITALVTDASPEKPYLNIVLRLDPAMVAEVMVELGQSLPPATPSAKAIDISPLDDDLLDAVVRLIRLTDAPHHASFLAPMITKEIIFRLFMGTQAGRLSHLATAPASVNHDPASTERAIDDIRFATGFIRERLDTVKNNCVRAEIVDARLLRVRRAGQRH